MFTWVKGNAYTPVATLYANNITLNQKVRHGQLSAYTKHRQEVFN